MNTLEEMMQRLKKRHPKKEVVNTKISLELIKTAIINTISPFYTNTRTHGAEIIGIDIPALTTELIDIKIYKEV